MLERIEEASRFNVIIHDLLLFFEDLAEELELHDFLVVVLNGNSDALVLGNEMLTVLIDIFFKLFPEFVLD